MFNFKNLLFLSISLTSEAIGQDSLKFDRRFVECENQWVAFSISKDSSYSFGFIYIDQYAGLTFDLKGELRISTNGQWTWCYIGGEPTSVKIRLQANQVRVAVIPSSKLAELKIPIQPEWLKFYQTDTSSVAHLQKWGWLYNSWDLPQKALTYLEKAETIDLSYPGLASELGYAYNVLGQYDKAITVLQKGIQMKAGGCYVFKELSYAQIHLGQLTQAAITCRDGIAACSDLEMKAEIAFNMAGKYCELEDWANFRIWAAETKKWSKKHDRFGVAIEKLEAVMKDK